MVQTKNPSKITKTVRWRALLIVAAPLILFGLYLNTANNHFYHRLHTAGLVWPQNESSYELGNTSGPNLKYVALGDSLTSGVGADTFSQSYSYLVAQRMVSPGGSVSLTPLATPGYKAPDIISQYVDKTIALQPDVITLLIGANDVHGMRPSTSEFNASYTEIVSKLQENTKAKIYTVAIPVIGTDAVLWQPYRYYYATRAQQFNEIIKDVSQKYGATYVDLYSATLPYAHKNSSYYSRDEFHPSNVGYAVWAEVIARDISR